MYMYVYNWCIFLLYIMKEKNIERRLIKRYRNIYNKNIGKLRLVILVYFHYLPLNNLNTIIFWFTVQAFVN